jgi:hypothetical protein
LGHPDFEISSADPSMHFEDGSVAVSGDGSDPFACEFNIDGTGGSR